MSKTEYGPEADLIIYGTLIVVSVIVAIIIWMSIRTAKKQEQKGVDLTVDNVLQHYGRRLLSKSFLWGIWQGRLALNKMHLFIKNEKGEDVATITYYYVPKEDVLKEIELADERYECIKEGALSNKTLLRKASSGEILMSCEHHSLKQIYYEGNSKKVKFILHHTTVFKDAQPIKIDDREVGQLISMYDFKCDAILLNFPEKNISTQEKLFIFASIPRS